MAATAGTLSRAGMKAAATSANSARRRTADCKNEKIIFPSSKNKMKSYLPETSDSAVARERRVFPCSMLVPVFPLVQPQLRQLEIRTQGVTWARGLQARTSQG